MKRIVCCAGLLLGLSPALSFGATVELKWQDNSTNETGFVVDRRPDSAPGAYAAIGTVGANVVTYTDQLITGTGVCYRVRAVNATGSSEPSNEVCPTIPTVPTAPSGMTIKISIEVGETKAPEAAPQTQGE